MGSKPKVTLKPTTRSVIPKKRSPIIAIAKASPKPAAKKPTIKKPALSKSERDFLAGQKLKEKIRKKTGVYPNTAN